MQGDDLHRLTETEARLAMRLAEAEEEARRRMEEAGAAGHLARRRAESEAARRAELRAVAVREVEASHRAARRTVLEARERLLDRVFRAARERLPRAGSPPGLEAQIATTRRTLDEREREEHLRLRHLLKRRQKTG